MAMVDSADRDPIINRRLRVLRRGIRSRGVDFGDITAKTLLGRDPVSLRRNVAQRKKLESETDLHRDFALRSLFGQLTLSIVGWALLLDRRFRASLTEAECRLRISHRDRYPSVRV